MKQTILSVVKFLVFLALGILLIWLAVKNLKQEEIEQIKKSLLEANYLWVALAMLIGIVAHVSRAMRWRMLLAPIGFFPKLSSTIYAVIIGYLGNLAINRLGEVLRCGILKRYEKIPFAQSFGTVIAERMIDTVVLLILFIISVWIEFARLHTYISDNIISPLKLKLHSYAENKMMMIVLVAGIILLAVLFFLFRKKLFQNPVVKKIKEVLLSFLDGIRSVAKVKNPLLFIFHSLFIWAMYLMTVYVCVFAFSETKTLSITDCLAIMCFGSLGVIATPGGIGAYQWIVLQIMTLWGYSTAMGVAFGWVVWLAQTVVILIGGLLSFGLLAIDNKEEKLSS